METQTTYIGDSYCKKCGRPFTYVGDNFHPELICQCNKTKEESSFSFKFTATPPLERIATALEKIAEIMEEQQHWWRKDRGYE